MMLITTGTMKNASLRAIKYPANTTWIVMAAPRMKTLQLRFPAPGGDAYGCPTGY
jgi:hypothetical protein